MAKTKWQKQEKTVTRTFQTRLHGLGDVADAFDANAAIHGAMEREILALWRKGETVSKADFCQKHGVPSRVFNSARIGLQGKLDGIRKKAEYDLGEVDAKIEKYEKRREKAAEKVQQNHLKLHGLQDQAARRKRLEAMDKARPKVAQYTDKLERLGHRREALVATSQAEFPALCFGSKRLFNAQNYLQENGFATHAAWKEQWQKARSSQFQIIGSGDESRGNGTVGLVWNKDGSANLTVPVYGTDRRVTLKNVRLPYGHDDWRAAAQAASERAKDDRRYQVETMAIKKRLVERLTARGRDEDHVDKVTKFLSRRRTRARARVERPGYAISYRFKRDQYGWRLFVTITQPVHITVTDRSRGVISVDFNADHLAVTELDGNGQLVALWRFNTPVEGKSSGQRRAMYRDLALKLARLAIEKNKPIVVEDLDFAQKKRMVAATGRRDEARMISGLAFSQFRSFIVSAASRSGVRVIFVNPAWTSVAGQALFTKGLGISIHHGAALAIGRRGMGIKEVPPREVEFRLFDGTVSRVWVSLRRRRTRARDDDAATWRSLSDGLKAARKEQYSLVYVRGKVRRQQARAARELASDAIPY